MAADWWNPNGKFKPLHLFNPTRIQHIKEKLISHFSCEVNSQKPFNKLKILDIGCGGGLLCEPMSRLGAKMTGIDASKSNDVVLNKEIDKDINWLINQNSDKYVIQLISATKKETITNYLEYFDDNKDIIEFSASISGKKYHILVYGLFDSISLAKANIEKLPKKARQIKPWIRTVESIKESIQ